MKKSGLVKAAQVLGIIDGVMGILPLLSPWFLLLIFLAYLIGIVGIILGVIAIVKKHEKAIVATIISVVGVVIIFAVPHIFAERLAEKTVESVANVTGAAMGAANWE